MCVVSVFCCDEFGSGGGTCGWVSAGAVVHFSEVSSMSMVVWDSTGSICKVNGYLSRMGFSSLG